MATHGQRILGATVHGYTCVPHPEPSSLLPPHTIPLGRPSALAPYSLLYLATSDVSCNTQDLLLQCMDCSHMHAHAHTHIHRCVCVLFSHSVMSDSLQPNGLQHSRPLCPLPSPRVCPSSCPLHRSCHPAISTSDALFSSALKLSQHQVLFQ